MRSRMKWGDEGHDTPVENIMLSYNKLLDKSSKWTTAEAAGITDEQIDSWFAGSQGNFTAKQYTDLLMTSAYTDAAHYCRGITIDGRACDLPTPAQLPRMYCDAGIVDMLDKTLKAFPAYGFREWMFNNAQSAWTCCEMDKDRAWYFHYNGSFSWYQNKISPWAAALPIQELAA